jgi:hypothetical protein
MVCGLTQGAPAQQADSLALRVQLDKQVYLYGEDIFLDFYLVNLTEDTLAVVRPDYYYATLDVLIRKADGDSLVKGGGLVDRRRVCYSDTLLPLDTAYARLQLSFSYGARIATNVDYPAHPLGDFTVRGYYLTSLVSNKVNYRVVVPTGSELDGYNCLMDVNRGGGPYHGADVAQEIDRFAANHPNSVYLPQLLSIRIKTWEGGKRPDNARFVELATAFIERFPNNHPCQLLLLEVAQRQEPELTYTLFETILSGKRNTRAAMYARGLIKNHAVERLYRGGP